MEKEREDQERETVEPLLDSGTTGLKMPSEALDRATKGTCNDTRSGSPREGSQPIRGSQGCSSAGGKGGLKTLSVGLVEDAQKGIAECMGSHVCGIMEMDHGGVESGTSVESVLLVHCKCYADQRSPIESLFFSD